MWLDADRQIKARKENDDKMHGKNRAPSLYN